MGIQRARAHAGQTAARVPPVAADIPAIALDRRFHGCRHSRGGRPGCRTARCHTGVSSQPPAAPGSPYASTGREWNRGAYSVAPEGGRRPAARLTRRASRRHGSRRLRLGIHLNADPAAFDSWANANTYAFADTHADADTNTHADTHADADANTHADTGPVVSASDCPAVSEHLACPKHLAAVAVWAAERAGLNRGGAEHPEEQEQDVRR